jgi:transcriptional regulator with XRE-family HTH domain
MAPGSGPNYATDGSDSADWSSGVEDESTAVMRAIGRQIKLWREAAGLTQTEFGAAVGYSEEMVSKVERGIRVPKPTLLDDADRVVGAGGKLAAMKPDAKEARYPKKVRDLAKLEAEAVELGTYGSTVVPGLMQTEAYARALFEMRRPSYSPDEVDRLVEARMARRTIFDRRPLPTLTFVLEEVTLRRPLGGKAVLRAELDHLLDVGQLRNVSVQVMPTDREDHAGMGGEINLLKLVEGATVGYSEAQLTSRLISNPKEVQILEMRYGMIRAQALTPRQSLAFIEKLRGEL